LKVGKELAEKEEVVTIDQALDKCDAKDKGRKTYYDEDISRDAIKKIIEEEDALKDGEKK